ncbi:hypothetical protein EON64_03105 [archaeon]|nr:MAG: hypothetical protein EON64_03105 [archaeon]
MNLAAVAGPVEGVPDAMMDVNYKAPAAASRAAEKLGFGHWVQSSTQATNAERAGQVPYSKGKAMLDFALTRAKDMPVTIACLGLLYSKEDGLIGQERKGTSKINLIDLALLPLTPIMVSMYDGKEYKYFGYGTTVCVLCICICTWHRLVLYLAYT